ncbi:MAG: AAA family ATPase [Blastocatellia bacterium]
MNELLDQLLHNPLFTGGFLLMISGAVMALCRRVPSFLWVWIKRRCIITADVLSDDQVYGWLKIWLDAQPYSKRARDLSVSSSGGSSDCKPVGAAEPRKPRIMFTPAPGVHLFLYKNRLLWLARERKETPIGNSGFTTFRETFTIRLFGRSQEIIRSLIDEAMGYALPPDDPRIVITASVNGYWRQVGRRQPRDADSVILNPGEFDSLAKDASEFLSSEKYYYDMGIPYRRGYLLYGVPGSGKTSTISALAGQLRLNLYILNLASRGMTDERLNDLLIDVPPGSIVLLEDIDAVFDGRSVTDDAKQSSVTFSALLNALDGAAAKDGRLLFMTTNHIERLDPALIRPGRVDKRLYFGYASREQVLLFFNRFYPSAGPALASHFAYAVSEIGATMAELQKHFLDHRDSPESAIAAWMNGHAAIREEYRGAYSGKITAVREVDSGESAAHAD